MNDTEILDTVKNMMNSNNSLTVTTILSVVFLGVLLVTKFYQIKEFSSCNKKNIQTKDVEILVLKLTENTDALNTLNSLLNESDEIKIKPD